MDWGVHQASLQALRFEVFVSEQGVPADLELDDDDFRAIHVAAVTTGGEVIGTGRILRSGKIGRMAVKLGERRRGIGKALLMSLLEEARGMSLQRVYLGAQLPAVPFYSRLGFVAYGGVFSDAGIDHQMMERILRDEG